MHDVQPLLQQYQLTHKQTSILQLVKPSIFMKRARVEEAQIPVGASKLGGLPDLPVGWTFPTYKNEALSFLAQLNFADLVPYDNEQLLPIRGLLYVFYDVVAQPWGFEEDAGCFRVLYFDGDEKELQRTKYPHVTDDYYPLPPFQINFEKGYTLPEDVEQIEFTDEELDRYFEMRQALISEANEPTHYLLGHPFSIQNDVFDDLQLGEDGLLLLQLDTHLEDEDMKWYWGDSGMLYFCLDKESLKYKQFDQVRFVLQCY